MEPGSILAQFGLAGLGLIVFSAVIVKLVLYIKSCFKASLQAAADREKACLADLLAVRAEMKQLTDTTLLRQHDTQMATNALIAANNIIMERCVAALERIGSGRFPAIPGT